NVHKLWSGAGASPHSGHFGHLPFGLEPVARREFSRTKVLVDLDLSLVELSDEQKRLALHVSPTGGGAARAFHPDRGIARPQTYRRREVGRAAQTRAATEQQCREHESLHGTILCRVRSVSLQDEPLTLHEYIGARLQKTSRWSFCAPRPAQGAYHGKATGIPLTPARRLMKIRRNRGLLTMNRTLIWPVLLSICICGSARGDGTVLFSGEKKRNNLVSELLEVAAISKSGNSFKFTRLGEGWIFISAAYKGKGKLTILLDHA